MKQINEIQEKSRTVEKELIGMVIFNAASVAYVSKHLTKEDFCHYGEVFAKVQDCILNGKDIFSTVNTSEFIDPERMTYSTRKIGDVCRDIKDLSRARKAYFILGKALEDIPKENVISYVSDVQRALAASISERTPEQEIHAIIDEFKGLQKLYEEKRRSGNDLIGLSTGYQKLDAVIDGLRPGHFWVIGGYTNFGKSFAALNIAASLIKQNKRVVFYSLEMMKTDILARLLGILTGISNNTILKAYPHDKAKVDAAMTMLARSGVSIISEYTELSELQFSMYEENLKKPVDLFVVDFIQLVTLKGAKSEYETITTTAIEFQQLAKRFAVPILVLSQISNEGAKYADEVVMSFKGSGAIAQAADLAIELRLPQGLTKEEYKANLAKGEKTRMDWSVRKNRHGRTGAICMEFDGRTGQFVSSEIEAKFDELTKNHDEPF